MNPLIITFVSAILASTGLWSFIIAVMQKREREKQGENEILKAIADLKRDIEGLKEDREKDNADCARNRILRFDDELRRHVDHSEEFFNQILEDVKLYKTYCSLHEKTYPNSKAELAISHIEECYQQCKNDNKFI